MSLWVNSRSINAFCCVKTKQNVSLATSADRIWRTVAVSDAALTSFPTIAWAAHKPVHISVFKNPCSDKEEIAIKRAWWMTLCVILTSWNKRPWFTFRFVWSRQTCLFVASRRRRKTGEVSSGSVFGRKFRIIETFLRKHDGAWLIHVSSDGSQCFSGKSKWKSGKDNAADSMSLIKHARGKWKRQYFAFAWKSRLISNTFVIPHPALSLSESH